MTLTHVSPDGIAPGNGYSHVVWGTGRFIAVSGQIALDEDGALVGGSDPEAQTRQVFENLRRCLEAAGVGFADVLKLTIFLTDPAVLPAVRVVREEYLTDPRPACSLVQVVALARPDLLLEIEAYAIAP
ncbi:RidA family protein [Longispora sp. NPDC051575]|uniref:RidA family protein n=1 Tax=Longispora sp. NPDC051575 TaxID=3154943 RepID=UPI003424E9AF